MFQQILKCPACGSSITVIDEWIEQDQPYIFRIETSLRHVITIEPACRWVLETLHNEQQRILEACAKAIVEGLGL